MKTEREKLITKRTEAEMTQRELAERMGISQPFLAAFESGKKDWPQERIEQAHAELDYYLQEPTPDEREQWRSQIRSILRTMEESS